jgi:hypothetical protein
MFTSRRMESALAAIVSIVYVYRGLWEQYSCGMR